MQNHWRMPGSALFCFGSRNTFQMPFDQVVLWRGALVYRVHVRDYYVQCIQHCLKEKSFIVHDMVSGTLDVIAACCTHNAISKLFHCRLKVKRNTFVYFSIFRVPLCIQRKYAKKTSRKRIVWYYQRKQIKFNKKIQVILYVITHLWNCYLFFCRLNQMAITKNGNNENYLKFQ